MERGLARIALIVSERSRTGLHDNLRTLQMSMYVLRLFLRSKIRWHLFGCFIRARR
jgi:hypothetical protein